MVNLSHMIYLDSLLNRLKAPAVMSEVNRYYT